METTPRTNETVSAGVIVVELDDVEPRRHPDRPNLYVAATRSPIEQRFAFLARGKGPAWIQGHLVALRSDLSIPTRPVDPSAIAELVSTHTRDLNRQGFTVNCFTYIWSVYVIELDPAAAKDPGKGVVYVGETVRTPEERFAQHMTKAMTTGGKRLYSSVVARYGKRLRMDLAPTEKCFDKESAKKAEAEWADHLRALGYVVKGGH